MERNRTKIQIENLQNQRLAEKSLARRAKISQLKKKIILLEKEVAYLEQLERKALEVSDKATPSPQRELSESFDPIERLRSQASQN
jgi:mannose/fructose/N-acetylgalactosamine-specific phosphotransferase system component IIB